jgi:hypothetical protein
MDVSIFYIGNGASEDIGNLLRDWWEFIVLKLLGKRELNY